VDELRRRGLPTRDADELAKFLKWLRILPYADQHVGRDILVFFYTEFKLITNRLREDPRGQRLCALFPVLARMMFQGASIFPAKSAQLARALMNCLRHYPRGAEAFVVLADLITDPGDGRFLHGHNANELPRTQLNALIESEHLRRAENFEAIYEAEAKYDGHRVRVMNDTEFRHDWEILKSRFPKDLMSGNVVLRSNDNEPGRMNRIQVIPQPPRFQDVFDFFCWKWFLDGMAGDEPIVAQLSFDVTPFGTTIFIPGYWSFDRRDIKWKELLKFHRSRGMKRQGAAFEPNRRDRENRERIFLAAERISRELGERGKLFVERCIRMAHLAKNTDPSYVYRVLREAKRNQTRVQPSANQQTLPLEGESEAEAA
jgi:hypothetical protein